MTGVQTCALPIYCRIEIDDVLFDRICGGLETIRGAESASDAEAEEGGGQTAKTSVSVKGMELQTLTYQSLVQIGLVQVLLRARKQYREFE